MPTNYDKKSNPPRQDDELDLFQPTLRREESEYFSPDSHTQKQAGFPPHVSYRPQEKSRPSYGDAHGRESFPPHQPYNPDEPKARNAYDHSRNANSFPPHQPYKPGRDEAPASRQGGSRQSRYAPAAATRRRDESLRRSYAPARSPNVPRGRTNWGRRLIFFASVLAFICVIGGICLGFWSRQYYVDTATSGVHVEGIDVSGMTRDEVMATLLQYQSRIKDQVTVTLTYESRSWVLTENDFSFSAPTDALVDAAMKVARTGSVWQRRREAREAEENQPNFSGEMDMTNGSLSTRLGEIASEVNISATNAKVQFNPESDSLFTFSNEMPGVALDAQATSQAIMSRLETESSFTMELVMVPVQASVTREDLAAITSKRAFFETKVEGGHNRRSNVQLALSAFNGLTVESGKTVSFNKTTGQRTEEAGYQEAAGINKDKGLEDTLGGGVCQASTTLYNAVLMADLEVVERHRHSFPSSYVKTGFDAMVNWPNKDFRFTNTSGSAIYIVTDLTKKSDGYYAQVFIYGKPLDNGITITREFEEISVTEVPKPEMIKDSSGKYSEYVMYTDEAYIAVPSRAGITVTCYLIYKDASGNEIEKKKLYTDEYAAITGKHYYGAEVRPEGTKVRLTNSHSDDTYLISSED